jgi:CRISPR-associated protein Csb3
MIEFELETRNPGEVLSACGLFNLASSRGEVMAQFTPGGRFCLDTPASLHELLFLLKPDLMEVADDYSWVNLAGVHLNWWAREGDKFKLWAGQVNPKNLFQELLQACEKLLDAAIDKGFMAASTPLTKRFGADPHSSWVSLDIGYSPNDQGMGSVHTRPFVEVLAMIGLQTFLPQGREKRQFVYSLWEDMLPLLPARLIFAGAPLSMPTQSYRFSIKKRGRFSFFNFSELEG